MDTRRIRLALAIALLGTASACDVPTAPTGTEPGAHPPAADAPARGPTAHPIPPPASGVDILYGSDAAGSRDIWGARVDGTGRINLSAVSHDPDGIYEELGARWSPDGSAIVFTSNKSGVGRKTYLMKADGTHAHPLNANGLFETDPFWGSDGTKIYYGRNPRFPTSDGRGCAPCPFWELYEYDVMTGTERRLTDNVSRDEHAVTSPDGRLVAFRRAERPLDCCNPTSVWVMRADGSGQRRLSPDNGRYETPRAWGPVSDRILTDWSGEIVLMDLWGGTEQLTSGGGTKGSAGFSPDGTTILFTQNGDLYFLDIATRAITPFLVEPGPQFASDWRPTGHNPTPSSMAMLERRAALLGWGEASALMAAFSVEVAAGTCSASGSGPRPDRSAFAGPTGAGVPALDGRPGE